MSATIIHFPNPLAKAIACIEHGMYWAVQELATSRHLRLIAEADAMLRAAADFHRYVLDNTDEAPPLLRLLENGYARHREFTGQGRGG